MDILIIVFALAALMTAAYRGYSVIIFAPIVALIALLFFEPISLLPAYTNLFMQKCSEYVRNFFPMFMMGAIFGKLIEISGFAKTLVKFIFKIVGAKHTMLAIVIVAAVLTYGGVSLFVVTFAVYPFAAEMFKMGGIPKRLIPGVIWIGGVTFTMDAMPGSPQIQNLIPTTFFKTDAYSAPIMGLIGSAYILILSMIYVTRCYNKAKATNETYDSGMQLFNEPVEFADDQKLPSPAIAVIPLIIVGVVNWLMTKYGVPHLFGAQYVLDLPGLKAPITVDVATMKGLWSVETALVAAIISTFILAFKPCVKGFTEGMKPAMSASLLAIMNTASEFGYGSIIAALPGFVILSEFFHNMGGGVLITEAIAVNALAGIVGSASGGLTIAMAAMSDTFIAHAQEANIPLEVAHRVASMASGGMDSLPHNGAVITALFVTGLTHRQAYGPIFVITIIKTSAVFFVIGVFYLTGIY